MHREVHQGEQKELQDTDLRSVQNGPQQDDEGPRGRRVRPYALRRHRECSKIPSRRGLEGSRGLD